MQDLIAFLQQSLADKKLSGSERAALAEWIAKNIKTEQDRGVARHTVFEVARSVMNSCDGDLIDWLEEVMKAVEPLQKAGPAAAIESHAYFSPGDACLSQIIHRFNSSHRTADLCVFTITDDRITRSILDAHRRGVKLRIITDNDKAFDLGSDIEQLGAAGIPIRVDATPYHMHHKFAIFDSTWLINGSYNWTRGAAGQNFENVTDTRDAKLIAAFQAEYEKLWNALATT